MDRRCWLLGPDAGAPPKARTALAAALARRVEEAKAMFRPTPNDRRERREGALLQAAVMGRAARSRLTRPEAEARAGLRARRPRARSRARLRALLDVHLRRLDVGAGRELRRLRFRLGFEVGLGVDGRFRDNVGARVHFQARDQRADVGLTIGDRKS